MTCVTESGEGTALCKLSAILRLNSESLAVQEEKKAGI